jgi:hypothetical protein
MIDHSETKHIDNNCYIFYVDNKTIAFFDSGRTGSRNELETTNVQSRG